MVCWTLSTTTTSGTASPQLRIKIPGGFTVARGNTTFHWAVNAGVIETGFCQVGYSIPDIILCKDKTAAGNWTLGTNSIDSRGSITFEIN
jgi:hypothetical protein